MLPQIFLTLLFAQPIFGQINKISSEADSEATLRSITIMPFSDNVANVYATKVQEQITNDLLNRKKWALREFKGTTSDADLAENPTTVKKILSQSQADALLEGKLIKGPNGLSITLNLYTKANGTLFSQESVANFQKLELKEVKREGSTLLSKLMDHMPYRGFVLSRRGQDVTVSLGKLDGAQVGDELTVILITKLNKHPKYGFLISSEKEVLGRIRLTKVDDTLSFGTLTSERERGVVQVNSKVLTKDEVTYTDPVFDAKGTALPELAGRDDAQVSFGAEPKEWLPEDPATFGKMSFLLGLGSITANSELQNSGGISASSKITPSLFLNGELWLNSAWSFDGEFNQAVGSFQNPIPGSKPEVLSVSTTKYGLYVGRNFLLSSSFWGPKFSTLVGYSVYKTFVDSSVPLAYTESTYSGLNLGFRGSFPFATRSPYSAGAELFFYLSPTLSEAPATSGSSSTSTINHFAIFGTYRIKDKLSALATLSFDLYSSTFSGSGSRTESATSTSQRLTTLACGVEHLF